MSRLGLSLVLGCLCAAGACARKASPPPAPAAGSTTPVYDRATGKLEALVSDHNGDGKPDTRAVSPGRGFAHTTSSSERIVSARIDAGARNCWLSSKNASYALGLRKPSAYSSFAPSRSPSLANSAARGDTRSSSSEWRSARTPAVSASHAAGFNRLWIFRDDGGACDRYAGRDDIDLFIGAVSQRHIRNRAAAFDNQNSAA